jgi:hypothetical protein
MSVRFAGDKRRMSFRKIFVWCFVTLVCITPALLAAYVIWRPLKAHWAPMLFFAFLIVGILEEGGYVVIRDRFRSRPTRESLLVVSAETRTRTPLVRFQLMTEKLLVLLEGLTGSWVFPMIRSTFSRRPESLIQYSAANIIEGMTAVAAAPTGLVLVLVAYGIAYVAPTEIHWTRAFLFVMGVNTMLRLVRYVVGCMPLPAQLRRSTLKPYLAFVVVAVTDLLSLALILNGILNWKRGEVASWLAIWNIIRRLCLTDSLGLVKDVLNGNEPRLADVLLTGMGMLYGGALLKALLKFKEFERSDPDYIQMAASWNLLGRYTNALKALEKIEEPSTDTYIEQAKAHIGSGQLEKAWEECKYISDVKFGRLRPGGTFMVLVGCAFGIPLKTETYVEIMRCGIENSPDLVVCDSLNLCLTTLGAKPQAFSPLFSDPAVAKRLPLCYGTLLIAEGKAKEARSWLDHLEPLRAAEKIEHLNLDLWATFNDPTITAQRKIDYIDEWNGQHFDEISGYVLSTNEGFDGFELTIVSEPILYFQIFAALVNSNYEHKWHSVLKQLKEKIKADKFGSQSISLLEYREVCARRFLMGQNVRLT